ncbi:MAG: type 2 isopentenyl-diphosphate Delta-isomerase [Spirochaetia bacterium]
MNTPTRSPGSRDIAARKEKHLTICTDPSRFQVEAGGAGFEGVRFLHDALPEIAETELDTSIRFLGQTVTMPFFISCMTGGSEGGFRANRLLAAAAQALGIPVGLGSIRPLLRDAGLFDHFNIKPAAPDVPVLANIGAVQARDEPPGPLLEMLARLQVQALVIHLNVGQELFQPEGDRDFRGVKAAIARWCERCPLPVIVKETGFGIRAGLIRELLDAGAAYVDIAGAGGTNWITVESYRLEEEQKAAAAEFSDWGIPTALLLASCGGLSHGLLASGGIRTGMDAAKALAMGAEAAGLALPVIRAVVAGGVDAVVDLFQSMERTLRAVMMMTGSRTVADLRRGTTWREPGFAAAVDSFSRGEAGGEAGGHADGHAGRPRAP